MRVLAGDIGGTNARLVAFEVADGRRQILHTRQYPSALFPGLGAIVSRFMGEVGGTFDRACFGVACPVVKGVCEAPNLPWTISAAAVAREIGVERTTLINDFEAVGYAIEWLEEADVETLQPGVPAERGTIALIGAGTGLGEAFLVWAGDRYRVHSSEGGHVTFAARTDTEWAIQRFLAREFGHVSYERLVSGPGMLNIFRALVANAPERARDEVMAEVATDGAAAISRRALDGSDPLCVEALDIFAATYGAQAGNLVLTVLATGGVYLAGGIAPRILPKLRDGTFLSAFRSKGRLSDLVESCPVRVIRNQDAGLLGAAAVAARM